MGEGDQCVYISMLMSATPDSCLLPACHSPTDSGQEAVQTSILTYGPRNSTNSQFCFDNDFISIIIYLHLFFAAVIPILLFLFLQVLLGYLFLLGNLLFWFRNSLFFFRKGHLSVAGRAHGGVDPTLSSVSPVPHFGVLYTWLCSISKIIYIWVLQFSITFCIFEHMQ